MWINIILTVMSWISVSVLAETGVDPNLPKWTPPNGNLTEFYRLRGMTPEMAEEHRQKTIEYKMLVAAKYGTEVIEENLTIFKDDTILTIDQLQAFIDALRGSADHDRVKRGIVDFSNLPINMWDFPIPYKFDGTQTASAVEIIRRSIAIWENNTCLRFQEREMNDTEHYIIFTSQNTGCWSYIGKVENTASPQPVNLQDPGCTNRIGTPLHELGHAIGLYHEQERSDRDNWVTIYFDNIESGMEHNFEIVPASQVDSWTLQYDYSSVMHYRKTAFSIDRDTLRTLEPINSAFDYTVGQDSALSFFDIKIVNLAYCGGVCSGSSLACLYDGYPDPNDCSQCRCPDGLGGTLCDQVAASDPVCGTTGNFLTALETEELLASPGADTGTLNEGTQCNWIIQAPTGCTIDVTVDEVNLATTNIGGGLDLICQSWLEIRDIDDVTGPRFCHMSTQSNTVTTTRENIAVLTLRQLFPLDSGWFRLRYKISDVACLAESTSASTAAETTTANAIPSSTTDGAETTPGPAETTQGTTAVTDDVSMTTGTPMTLPPSSGVEFPVYGYALIGVGALLIVILTAVCTSMRSADAAAKAGVAAAGKGSVPDYSSRSGRLYGYDPRQLPQNGAQNYRNSLGSRAVPGFYPSVTPSQSLPTYASAYSPGYFRV